MTWPPMTTRMPVDRTYRCRNHGVELMPFEVDMHTTDELEHGATYCEECRCEFCHVVLRDGERGMCEECGWEE